MQFDRCPRVPPRSTSSSVRRVPVTEDFYSRRKSHGQTKDAVPGRGRYRAHRGVPVPGGNSGGGPVSRQRIHARPAPGHRSGGREKRGAQHILDQRRARLARGLGLRPGGSPDLSGQTGSLGPDPGVHTLQAALCALPQPPDRFDGRQHPGHAPVLLLQLHRDRQSQPGLPRLPGDGLHLLDRRQPRGGAGRPGYADGGRTTTTSPTISPTW
jgi:hypothetical protein